MDIRELDAQHAEQYHPLRLRGLREHPEAFTSSHDEEAAKPLSWARARLDRSPAAPHNFVLGAFHGDGLVGIVGVSVDMREKIRHKGHVFGMYVAPEHAGRGAGRALIEACIRRARAIPGLEQLDLTVTDSNARAKALYEQAGFRAFGVAPKAIKLGNRYFDKCHMALDL